MHLQPGELVDIAEGTRSESSVAHLVECQACQRQVADLTAMMSAAADVHVPEPSPLFWDHLSARVREGVLDEGAPRRSFWSWPRLLVPAAAAAALILAVTLNPRVAPVPAPVPPSQSAPVAAVELLSDQPAADDTALTLVADLSADFDFDADREAGLAARGSAEHAVTHLNGAELRELQRLLQEELAHSGA